MGGSETETSNPIMFFLGNDTKTVVRLQGENFVRGRAFTQGLTSCFCTWKDALYGTQG